MLSADGPTGSAQKLYCTPVVKTNQSTNENFTYTEKEQKDLAIILTIDSRDIIYLTLQGQTETFKFHSRPEGNNLYFSTNNYYLLNIKEKDNIWFLTMKINGVGYRIGYHCWI